ncbi:MAG: hypothetical protein LBO66_03365 [Deltaproteobacteria bacterium]|jgi:hypothetical protein|nr:hypothetical protein [Deltaproteobacteria bacterium]
MSLTLFSLFALAFLAFSALTGGTALAFKKKRGGKGHKGHKSPRKSAVKLSPSGRKEARGLPGDWPKWDYPPAENLVEKTFRWAEGHAKNSSPHGAAHGWDGARAVTLLFLGPEDPRAWAALSRSARSLSDHALSLPDSEGGEREFRLRAAASVAMGALAGFDEVERAAAKGAGDGPPAPPVAAGERDFALKTLERINASVPSERRAAFAPRAARSLAEALYPDDAPFLGRAGQKPLGALFPSEAELRDALGRAGWRGWRVGRVGGPGPGSREALSLMSRLGLELWDSGDSAFAWEATELLREASAGLDRLLGPGDPEALAAKERLARRHAGLYGYGKIIPSPTRIPDIPDLAVAREYFRDIIKLAPQGEAGRLIRKRAETGLVAAGVGRVASLDAREAAARAIGDFMARLMSASSKGNDDGGEFCDYGDEEGAARWGFDLAALGVRAALGDMVSVPHAIVLARRRNVLGGRHPETACSLALAGDMLGAKDGAVVFWALALEALAGRGERYAAQEADLKRRIGLVSLSERDYGLAAGILAEADELYLACRGVVAGQERLECAALLAEAHYGRGDVAAAEKIYGSLNKLMERGVPRKNREPTLPSDSLIHAVALAGTAAAMFYRGERVEATHLMSQAMDIREREEGDSFLGNVVDARARGVEAVLRGEEPEFPFWTGEEEGEGA